MKKLIALTLLATTLMACKEITVKDGKVPAEYLALAQNYEGTYVGQFSKINGQIEIDIIDQKPVVTFKSETGSNDILGKCDSTIGELRYLGLSKKDKQDRVDYAFLRFNTGKCKKIEGRFIELHFKHDKNQSPASINVSILSHEKRNRQCSGVGENRSCDTYFDKYYIKGSFKKI